MRFLSLFVMCFVVWVGLASAQEVLEHATFLRDLRIPTPHSMILDLGKKLDKKAGVCYDFSPL